MTHQWGFDQHEPESEGLAVPSVSRADSIRAAIALITQALALCKAAEAELAGILLTDALNCLEEDLDDCGTEP